MRLYSFFHLLIILTLLLNCGSKNSVASDSSPISAVTKTENSIVYLFFEIEKSENGLEKVKLTGTKISEGFIKNASIENKASLPGNLLISFLNKSGAVLEERIIEDPLNPILEVYAEEGLSKNKLNLKKAEFSVRFNQKGEISNVKVEKITEKSKNTLITLKL